VEALVLNGTGELETEVSLEDFSRYLAEPRTLVWCDIATTGDGQDGPYGRLLREVFGFDELTIEDCFTTNHLPKVNLYDDYLFVVLFSFRLSEKRRRVETVEIDMYVGENYVVCIHSRPLGGSRG
jgi:magnesium transporter